MPGIAILSHWHTASTLLAKTFQLCGMEVGNSNTYWDEKTCSAQCEHSRLNMIGDQLSLGQISEQDAIVEISRILIRYKQESERNGWKFYGVKITHGVQSKCWAAFKYSFDTLWGDPLYVTTIRDPEGIVHSTRLDSKWSDNGILDSILDAEPAVKYIEKRGVPFYFPKDWRNGMVEVKVRDIGLEWTDKALRLLDTKRIHEVDRRGLYA